MLLTTGIALHTSLFNFPEDTTRLLGKWLQVTTCFIRSNCENSNEKVNKVSGLSKSLFPFIPKMFRM